jgi:acyl carrier protein
MGEVMDRAEILNQISKLLERYSGNSATRGPLSESMKLAEDLDIDSARLVDIVIDVEEKFHVKIDDSKLDRLKTVGDIITLVSELQSGS